MGAIWTDEARMEAWRKVEVACCEALDGPTDEDLDAVRAATFTVEAVNEREAKTDHDVAAFVDVLAASAGEPGRWIHYGLTSSDVLDTALALQIKAAGELIVPAQKALTTALINVAREHADTVCVGRTHGVHAEPTTFGIKIAGFAFESARNAERLERAIGAQCRVGGEIEASVMERLGISSEPVSTQVVPRDRHAELVNAISLAGAGLERLATEIRHLQRTEVGEASEPFAKGVQKGSSAMPHKRNPIKSENITGLARLLRGYAVAATENVALWHERDISHSAPERVILPDATILLHYMLARATALIEGLVVNDERMKENINLTYGALFSQRLLLALVEAGSSRDDAYRTAQRLAQKAWDERTPLRGLAEAEDLGIDLDAVFDPEAFIRHRGELIARLDSIS